MSAPERSSSKFPLREFLVPALMLFAVAAYWWDAAGLSKEALAFPAVLTGVLLFCLAGVAVSRIWAGNSAVRPTASDDAADTAPDKWTWAKRLAVVALPFAMVLFIDVLGGLALLFIYVAALLWLLGERRWALLVALPIGLSFSGIALFKFILYARIPDGLVPLGSLF